MALPPQRPGAKPGPNPAGNGTEDLLAERHQSEVLAAQCQDLEERLEQLKARYEMWFLGVDKREPNRDRDELKREVERIKTAFTRNTGLKFRIQTLAARFLSYERMWLRSAREKEAGTYRRDLVRARRHVHDRAKKPGDQPASPAAAAPADPPAPPAAAAPPGAPDAAPGPRPDLATPIPFVPPRAPPPPPRAPAPAPAAVVAEKQMRALYDAYIDAKRRCNEDVSRLTYDAVSRSVQKQVPELLARYKARSVEFKVVIQGGKAVLKAVPRS